MGLVATPEGPVVIGGSLQAQMRTTGYVSSINGKQGAVEFDVTAALLPDGTPDNSVAIANGDLVTWKTPSQTLVAIGAVAKLANALNLVDYTGVPDGVTDNTAGIDACFHDAETQDRAVYAPGYGVAFPYVYSGNGSRLTKPVVFGDGFRKTWFKILGLASVITDPVDGGGALLGISSLYCYGIATTGGFGMIRLDYTGTQAPATGRFIVDACFGTAYAGAWISTRATVTGYWTVNGRCQGAVGHGWAMVMAGQADGSEINILMNTVKRGIKFGSEVGTYAPPSDDQHSLAHNSAGARISGMFSTNDGTGTGRIASWFVPDTLTANPTTKGQGGGVFSNFRFSGENYDPSDKRILVADENRASGLLWGDVTTVLKVNVDTGSGAVSTSNLTASTLTGAALQTALEGLAGVGAGKAFVAASSPTGGPWHVWLDDTLRTATITVTTVNGTPAQWISDERTRQPLLTIASTGLMSSPIVTDDSCFIAGSGAFPTGPLLYSTCGNIDFHLRGRISSTKPQYVVQYAPESVARAVGLANAIGIVGPFSTDKLTNDKASATACNVMGAVTVVDPQGMFAHRPDTTLPGLATGVGLTDFITGATGALTASGSACVLTTGQTDGLGGTDGIQAVFSADSGNAYLNIAAAALKQDVPLWLEFDLAPPSAGFLGGGGTAATEVVIKVTDASDDTLVLFQRSVPIPASGWVPHLLLITLPVIPAAGIHVGWRRTPGVGTVGASIGRTYVYHARRPRDQREKPYSQILPATGSDIANTNAVTVMSVPAAGVPAVKLIAGVSAYEFAFDAEVDGTNPSGTFAFRLHINGTYLGDICNIVSQTTTATGLPVSLRGTIYVDTVAGAASVLTVVGSTVQPTNASGTIAAKAFSLKGVTCDLTNGLLPSIYAKMQSALTTSKMRMIRGRIREVRGLAS